MTCAFAWALLAAGAVAAPAGGASAQEPAERPARPFIRVSGEATVQARPDRAEIDIGVVAQAPTAQAAAAQNAQQLDAVLAALRTALGPAAAIRTAGYSLNPVSRPPREGLPPAIAGYTATNTAHVTTDDLAAVGRAIDAAMQAGANQIQRLQFTLKDEGAARAQALREAAIKARAQAEVLAGALGLKIVRVLSVTEGAPVAVRPLLGAARAMGPQAPAAPTPVEPGSIDVRAEVALVVEVTP
jgi:uncharacterized protein YggE